MDIRDSERIATLPNDLKEVAEQMLQEKFGLAHKGEVVEKKKNPEQKKQDLNEVEEHPFIDPNIFNMIQEYYYDARRKGGNPDVIYMSPPVQAALMRDDRAREQSRGYYEPTIFGMKIRSERSINDNRIVLVNEFKGRVEYDSRRDRAYYGGF